ncbi:hypothetical protein RRG08_067007 [Elysia crispata]|uniref:Uncharacterized protein n=1 Tax=Elysia crispata TaxID=231223 RepID=A0AAE0Z7M5_9GAST|nr:hypothetical protein RRG08_067007 [Elysia crispata]
MITCVAFCSKPADCLVSRSNLEKPCLSSVGFVLDSTAVSGEKQFCVNRKIKFQHKQTGRGSALFNRVWEIISTSSELTSVSLPSSQDISKPNSTAHPFSL